MVLLNFDVHPNDTDVTYHDGLSWEVFPDLSHKGHKVLRISVGHIQTDVMDVRDRFNNPLQLIKVFISSARAHGHMLQGGGGAQSEQMKW